MDIAHEIEAALVGLFAGGVPGMEFIAGSDRTAQAEAYPYTAITVTAANSRNVSGRVGMAQVDMMLVSNMDAQTLAQRRAAWDANMHFLRSLLHPSAPLRHSSSRVKIYSVLIDDEADASQNQLTGDLVKFRVPYSF